jgi:hypothetical protein
LIWFDGSDVNVQAAWVVDGFTALAGAKALMDGERRRSMGG